MKCPWVNARVSLAGPIVRCRVGSTAHLEWRDVHSRLPAFGCEPSPAARAINPQLPKYLWFGPAVGDATIGELRDRAMRRDFERGRIDRHFVLSTKLGPSATAAMYAVAIAAILCVFEFAFAQASARLVGDVSVSDRSEFNQVTAMVRGILRLALVVVPSIAALIAAINRRRETVLAIRITSDGICYSHADGRSEFRSWRTALAASDPKRRASAAARILARYESGVQQRNPSDLSRVKRAAKAVLIGREKGTNRAEAMASFLIAFSVMVAIYSSILLLATVAGLQPPKKPGSAVRTPAEMAVVWGVVSSLFMAMAVLAPPTQFGLHRYWLRWRQMWRIPRSQTARRAGGEWPPL